MNRARRKRRVTWRAVGLFGVSLVAVGLIADGLMRALAWPGLALAAAALWPRGAKPRPARSLPLSRKALFSVITLVAALALAEIILRATGYAGDPRRRAVLDIYGKPPDPFEATPMPSGGQGFRVAADGFRPDTFAAPKPSGEVRIFSLGGSTTAGYGTTPEEAYPARVQALLRSSRPEVRVINLGRNALESFRIRAMVDDVLKRFEPDVLVVHTGHNDFINASRVVDVSRLARLSREAVGRRLAVMRTLRHSRVYRLVEHGVWALQDRGRPTSAEDCTRLRRELFGRALVEYKRNVRAIARRARQAGVPLALCTVVSVTFGLPPFESVHREGLTYAERAAFLEHAGQMRHLLMRRQPKEAEAEGRMALRIDDGHANTLYVLGLCLLAQKRTDEARELFRRARDEDTSGWRAPGSVNRFLKKLAGEDGATLADLEQAFRARSRTRIVDTSLFVDSVHPTLEGYGIMAETIADAIRRSGALRRAASPTDGAATRGSEAAR